MLPRFLHWQVMIEFYTKIYTYIFSNVAHVVPTSHLASYCCCCCSCRSFFSFSILRSTLYLPSFLLYKVFSVSFWCISAAFYSAADGTRSFYFLLQLQHYRDGPYYLIHSANILICSSITSAKVFWNKLRLSRYGN